MTRVGVIGYGVIGRRVADAVRLQADMQVSGMACRPGSSSVRDALLQGYDIHWSEPAPPGTCFQEDATPAGTMDDLLDASDVILDCTPSGGPGTRAAAYSVRPDKTIIVQGGEQHAFGGVSFNAFANYAEAAGKRRVRVISCSSTGLTRIFFVLDRVFGLEHAFAALVRRSADPGKRSKNPFNAMTPVPGQSHHAPDVQTVLPDLPIFSFSADAGTTLGHVVAVTARTCKPADADALRDALTRTPRILVGSGVPDTAALAAYFEDIGRRRRDRPEIYVWEEGLHAHGRDVRITFCVHMESITIPETIDCIRATLGLELDPWRSIKHTDEGLDIVDPGSSYPPFPIVAP